jgi:hypothetical protein
MKNRMVLGVLPAVGISAIPVLVCPACWPALASVLGAVGLTFLTNRTYLLWVNLAVLALALTILFAKRHANGYRPFLLGTAGAALIVVGKFVLNRDSLSWSGLAVLIFASVLLMFSGNKATCSQCRNIRSVVRGGQ